MSRPSIASLAGSLAAIGLLAACTESTSPRSAADVSVSFTTSASPAAAAAGFSPDVLVSDGTNSLVITRVQLVLKEVELETQDDSDDCDSSGSGNPCPDDANETEIGPFLVDLPLTSGVSSPITMAIPAGSYHEIEFKLDSPDDDTQADLAFRAAHPEFRNVSVKVEGTYNGAPFTYTMLVEAEMELEFSPNIMIEEGTNITVQVDVSRWFRSGAAVIDPSTARAGGSNAALVRSNIISSFQAFGDDDRDGDDDNSGPGSGDDR